MPFYLSLEAQVSLLNVHGRDNLCLMKCFSFQLVKFCSINIKCWGDISCFILCRAFLRSWLQYSVSEYYSDVLKFINALLTLSAINLPFVSDNYKLDFTEVWQSYTFFQKILRLSSMLLIVYFSGFFSELSNNFLTIQQYKSSNSFSYM